MNCKKKHIFRIGVADIPPRHQHEPKLLSTGMQAFVIVFLLKFLVYFFYKYIIDENRKYKYQYGYYVSLMPFTAHLIATKENKKLIQI